MQATLGEVCAALERRGFSPRLEGDPHRLIQGINTLDEAGHREIAFLSNPRYEKQLQTTQAGAVVLKPGIGAPEQLACIRADDPYAAIAHLMVEYYGYRRHVPARPELAGSQIAATARVGENATIYPGATIAEDAVIGRNAVIYPGVYLGPRCRLGDDVVLYPNVVVYEDCVLGNRVTIHAGTVIGEDGLGYAPVNGAWVKIPQIGTVEIEDDVEIGSNCSIDRATLGRTRIGRGTKMSNLIAIGHGTTIGEHCLFVAQVGLAGSVQVGNHVTLAGQCGIVGHIKIGDRATVGARAGVTASVPEGETVLGEPAIPIRDARRQVAHIMRLPELGETVKQLQKELGEARTELRAARDAIESLRGGNSAK